MCSDSLNLWTLTLEFLIFCVMNFHLISLYFINYLKVLKIILKFQTIQNKQAGTMAHRFDHTHCRVLTGLEL